MYLAALLPEHNPLIDDHIIYAVALLLLAKLNAGDHLGFGKKWSQTKLVRTFKFLR